VASLPPLRRCLGRSAAHVVHGIVAVQLPLDVGPGSGCPLSLESFRFYACLRFVSTAFSELRWSSSGGCFATSLFAGGYFAAVMLCGCFAAAVVLVDDRFGWMLYRLGCVGRVDALPPLMSCRPSHP
jgi:hypothetical protein